MPTGSLTGDSQKVANTSSIISYHWAGAGTTNAPSATNLPNYTVGVNTGGAATGLVYHVIDGSWVPTGTDVANLYGLGA
jgi:hypothetical protein